MASPFLAITLDAKRRIAQVAGALAQPHPGPAAWGLLELLEDVWRRKDPSVSALLLSACFGPDPRMPAALVAFGFLVVKGDAWELCAEEADRLLMTHKQRVAAGKARAASADRQKGAFTSGQPSEHQRPASGAPAGPPAADQLLQPAASSQHQELLLPPAAGAPKKSKRPPSPDAPEKSDPTYKALVDALFAAFLREIGQPYEESGRDWPALQRLRGKHQGEEIIRRWVNGLRAKYAAKVRAIHELEVKWNHCATPEESGSGKVGTTTLERKVTVL